MLHSKSKLLPKVGEIHLYSVGFYAFKWIMMLKPTEIVMLDAGASGVIGIETGAQGPNYGVTSAYASAWSTGEALGMIQDGHANKMLAGGTEATIVPLSFAGFCAMRAMNTEYNDEPTLASRPFDSDRCGFVMGEGAGMVLLESLESAQSAAPRFIVNWWGMCHL